MHYLLEEGQERSSLILMHPNSDEMLGIQHGESYQSWVRTPGE